jgi:DNA-3-methyladenine glycosylase II
VLPVVAPYRLDLTAAVLRRTAVNLVDVAASDGFYRRAFGDPAGTVVATVRQSAPDALTARLEGPARAREHVAAVLPHMLGTVVDVAPFLRAARGVAWLAPLARRMRGVHPARYPTLWEACVNAVVFQHVSLQSASAIMRRLIERVSEPVDADGIVLRPFPSPAAVAALGEDGLRATGLSTAKIRALQGLSLAALEGTLDAAPLEALPSAAAAERLRMYRGIGAWTAALILLRGLGRLDVFPENDSGAARGLRDLTGDAPDATADVLDVLGDQRGMLYFHLLLARLEARGELPEPRLP